MDEVEKSKKELVELLKSIKTLDDMKEHKEEVLTLIEELGKSAVNMIKKFRENVDSMTQKEIEKELGKFQDDEFLIDEKIGNEFMRIDDIPGVVDHFETLQDELEVRMGPQLEQFGEEMTKLLEKFAKDMVDGMVGGFEEAMKEMGLEEEDESQSDTGSQPEDE